jgi:hypothetical protein
MRCNEEARLKAVGKEHEALKKEQYRRSQRLFELRSKERELISEISGGQGQNKNLAARIHALDEQVRGRGRKRERERERGRGGGACKTRTCGPQHLPAVHAQLCVFTSCTMPFVSAGPGCLLPTSHRMLLAPPLTLTPCAALCPSRQQVVRQQELLYNVEFQLQQMERKVARAGGVRSEEETRALNTRIEKLASVLEGVNGEHSMLLEQVRAPSHPPRCCGSRSSSSLHAPPRRRRSYGAPGLQWG